LFIIMPEHWCLSTLTEKVRCKWSTGTVRLEAKDAAHAVYVHPKILIYCFDKKYISYLFHNANWTTNFDHSELKSLPLLYVQFFFWSVWTSLL
jgi:hypothetical protein